MLVVGGMPLIAETVYTKILFDFSCFSLTLLFPSSACAISDGAEVVLTGGLGNRRDVTVYSLTGFERNLPRLQVGREYHACASYLNTNDEKVEIFIFGTCLY